MSEHVGIVLVLKDQKLDDFRSFVLDSKMKERFSNSLQMDVHLHAHVLVFLCLVHLVDFDELNRLVVLDELDTNRNVSMISIEMK